MPETVRVGIIGAGGIARHAHVPGYKAQKDVELAAICDIVREKATEMAAENDIPHAYGSCEEMLEEEALDAVSVCTPNFAHKEMTLMALEAGLHVLCEKPIAMDVQEGREMVEAARERDLVLQVGLHQRFTPEVQTVKRFVDAGELGDIYYGEATYMRRRGIPSWGVFTQKKYQGGGALIDIGVHTLDQTMWLMGNPKPVAVSGMIYDMFGKRSDMANTWGPWDPDTFDVDDMSVALVRFEGGVTLILRACWAAHIGSNESGTRILGTEGGASTRPLRIFRDAHETMVDIAPSGLPQVEPHTEEIAHFVDCVRGEAKCLVVPEQVLDVQAVIDAIYKSAEEGREVRLEELD